MISKDLKGILQKKIAKGKDGQYLAIKETQIKAKMQYHYITAKMN